MYLDFFWEVFEFNIYSPSFYFSLEYLHEISSLFSDFLAATLLVSLLGFYGNNILGFIPCVTNPNPLGLDGP